MFRFLAYILFAVAVLASTGAAAWEPYHPDVLQEREENLPGEFDHLEPAPERGNTVHLARFGVFPAFSDAQEWTLSRDEKGFSLRSWELETLGDGRTTEVRVETRQVSRELADLIYETWINALLESRYGPEHPITLDETGYYFSSWLMGVGTIAATTGDTGTNRPPAWLRHCGNIIFSFGRSAAVDERALVIRLAGLRDLVFSYYKRKYDRNEP